jgi:3',5'-cyclic-AMP phosphodiesterase
VRIELTTVADDAAVVHADGAVHRFDGLTPATTHTLAVDGHDVTARTLARPGGERLATVVTVNDLHFGETICGAIDDDPRGPKLSVPPEATPYPDVMNYAAVAEIDRLAPKADALVAKGDLTNEASPAELDAFGRCWVDHFGARLTVVRGNHDSDRVPAAWTGHHVVDVPGLRLAVIDTVIPGQPGGQFDADAAAWLDAVAAESDRPVLALGHHPLGRLDADVMEAHFEMDPASSQRLVDLAARRPRLVAYAAGHTHRNRVRHFDGSGAFPFIEVGCVKDFPGSWAEYRVFEGGVLQVHHRISAPEALAWSERCRVLYSEFGVDYTTYALGRVEDRCFTIPWRTAPAA